MSAQIICLADRRSQTEDVLSIDLRTAVDVAIRDLTEIESNWQTLPALERLAECRAMLQSVFADS